MSFNRIYGLFLRHFFLIKSSLPRILDLIYWPTIQIILWGFISLFFSTYSNYYNNTLGVILTCAILYDFLFRSSISFNMLFLEEIWSRNFTNLFIAPMRISEIIISLVVTALIRTLIGLVPAILITSPLFGISILNIAKNINHSCDPNCEVDGTGYKIYVTAIKDIKKNEELTYDYGFSYDEDYKQFPCKCRAKNCCGYIVRSESRWRINKKFRKSSRINK